jgi:hypothetical protein
MAKIKITIGSEILNTSLHILGGGLISYAMVPLSPWWIILLVPGAFGGIREYLQYERNKEQPWWIIVVDILGWIVGGAIYIGCRSLGWFPTL